MKHTTTITFAVALAVAVSGAYAQSAPKGAHEHGAPAPCCDTGPKITQASQTAQAAQTYKASGVVKKTDVAKGTATIAHGPVKELNWPAMTMAFKVKDKALLDKLTVNKKVEFTLAQEGKDYVITGVQ